MNYELAAKVISHLYKRKESDLLTVRAISKIIKESYTSTRRTILELEQQNLISISKLGDYNVTTLVKSPKLLPYLVLNLNQENIIKETKKICEELK